MAKRRDRTDRDREVFNEQVELVGDALDLLISFAAQRGIPPGVIAAAGGQVLAAVLGHLDFGDDGDEMFNAMFDEYLKTLIDQVLEHRRGQCGHVAAPLGRPS